MIQMNAIRLIKPYFIENRRALAFGIAGLISLDILTLIIPRIIKRSVDDLTGLRVDFAGLLTYSLYIVGVSVVIAVLRYFSRRAVFGTSRKIEEGLRNTLFGHIQTLSASYFDRAKTGDLMAHATNDIQHVRMAAGMGLVALTDAVFLGIAAIGFMAYINVRLTLLVFIPMPFVIFASRIFGKNMHRRYQRVQAAFSDLTEAVRERFTGIRVIKSFVRENDEILKINAVSSQYIQKNMQLVRITGSFFPMMVFFTNLSLAAVLYFGGRQTIFGTITPGDFVAFIQYLGLISWPIMALGWVTNLLQRGKASLDRIDVILSTLPEITECISARPLFKARGQIVFEDVCFAYSGRKENALTDICFCARPGQIIGIVGPQGAGKTTVLNLIPRLYDVCSGRILLDGIDIREFKLDALRSRISYMPQEPTLFADTVSGNIMFTPEGGQSPELSRAVQSASLYDTVLSLPNGFNTLVGERGVILSGGQKQRVALARAFLNDAPVLILDDPISQVDRETGDRIIQSIRSLRGVKTVIIVSHRLSAVRFADAVIVMDKGRVIGSGAHEELLLADPYYARTFFMQEMENTFHVQ
jgi:ATP-binding cassette, subfamily B, multidrug efflux pump